MSPQNGAWILSYTRGVHDDDCSRANTVGLPKMSLSRPLSRASLLTITPVLRSDGTEKVEVPDAATVKQLRQQLEAQFKVPFSDQTLSLDQKLARLQFFTSMRSTCQLCERSPDSPLCDFPQLLAPDIAAFKDMLDANKTLKSLNIGHGSIIFFRYSVEREVTKNPVQAETRAFGAFLDQSEMHIRMHDRLSSSTRVLRAYRNRSRRTGAKMTMNELIAKQTRIERQDLPKCQSVSFDGNAANIFQGCAFSGRTTPRPNSPAKSVPASLAPSRLLTPI